MPTTFISVCPFLANLKAKITYKDLKPVITIKEALNKKQFLFKPRKVKKGNPSKKIKNSKNTISFTLTFIL